MEFRSTHQESINSWLKIACYFALVIATFVIYFKVGIFSFVNYDDPIYVTENPFVLSGLNIDSIIWAFKTGESNWHPVTILSHALDCQFFGADPGMHHLVNLFFHIANSLLLLFLLEKMTGRFWRSFIVALLFAVHPLHVESVAWIAERKDVLSTFWIMLAMIAYLQFVKNGRFFSYWLCFIFFLLGLMSKSMMVSFPCILLLLDFWPLKRLSAGSGRRAVFLIIKEKIPFVLLSAIFCGLTVWTQKNAGAMKSIEIYPLLDRITNALTSYILYLYKMALPHQLAVFYPFPQEPQLILASISLVLLIAFSLYSINQRHRQGFLLTGWLWYLITLLPVIGIIQVGGQAMADRYTYLPSIGIFVAIVWWIGEKTQMYRHMRVLTAVAALGILVSYSAVARVQVNVWSNSINLFEHALKNTDASYIAHNNLARAYEAEGRLFDSKYQYEQAVKSKPDFFLSLYNLAGVLIDMGHFDEAIKHLTEAATLSPQVPSTYYNLGIAYYNLGDRGTASDNFLHAVSLDDVYPDAHFNLGVIREKQNRPEDAIIQYKKELRGNGRHARSYTNIGRLYLQTGQYEAAEYNLNRAYEINPRSEETEALLRDLRNRRQQ